MDQITGTQLWAFVLAAASAVVLLANAAEKIGKAISAAKKPGQDLSARMDTLETEVNTKLSEYQRYFDSDKKHLERIDEGERVVQQALLALLDHGIDGNNVKQMEEAKDALQKHLINK